MQLATIDVTCSRMKEGSHPLRWGHTGADLLGQTSYGLVTNLHYSGPHVPHIHWPIRYPMFMKPATIGTSDTSMG